MKRNMEQWVREYLASDVKKSIPILSFPGIHYMQETVEALVKDAQKQASCMEAIAKHFDTGAAVSLMDLSVEAEAFGCPVTYSEAEVPTVHGALITCEEQAQALEVPSALVGRPAECVRGIAEAVIRIEDRPVLAGMIGPFSLAGRILDMTEIMILCYEEPEMVETILKKVTQFLIEYARAFKEAGANGIMMAEPAAGLLSPGLMEEFSNPYVNQIRDAVEDESFLVIYHNCGNVVPLLKNVAAIGARAYSFGNAIDLEEALKVLPLDCMVLGNIDPAGTIRQGTPESIKAETKELLERCSGYPNFVVASGCDIPPETSLENIQAFFDAVEEFYADKSK